MNSLQDNKLFIRFMDLGNQTKTIVHYLIIGGMTYPGH